MIQRKRRKRVLNSGLLNTEIATKAQKLKKKQNNFLIGKTRTTLPDWE